MKITDLSPIFLYNMQHKVLMWAIKKNIEEKKKVVRLECINPTSHLKKGEIYYAYVDTANASRYYYPDYPVYKIFLPILGARKYSMDRFKVLGCCTISSKDFYRNKYK